MKNVREVLGLFFLLARCWSQADLMDEYDGLTTAAALVPGTNDKRFF
jgi:hypothetical protein